MPNMKIGLKVMPPIPPMPVPLPKPPPLPPLPKPALPSFPPPIMLPMSGSAMASIGISGSVTSATAFTTTRCIGSTLLIFCRCLTCTFSARSALACAPCCVPPPGRKSTCFGVICLTMK